MPRPPRPDLEGRSIKARQARRVLFDSSIRYNSQCPTLDEWREFEELQHLDDRPAMRHNGEGMPVRTHVFA